MDLFEEFLEDLDGHVVEGNDPTSPSSVQAALAEAPPVSLPPDSSICLLDECFANVWNEPERAPTSGNSSSLPLPKPSVESDAPSVAADPTSPVPKSGTGSRLSIAVKNRIQRDNAANKDTTVSTCTTEPVDTGAPLMGSEKGDGGGNTIVTTCFQSFLAEMKDFQQNSSQLKTTQDLHTYANYLHKKYIVRLDKVNDDECATAAKPRQIIENFITKLRARSDGQVKSATVAPSAAWACAVCTFQNSPGHYKCQTCGRARGTTPKKTTPPKPPPIISALARAKKSNKMPIDRRKDMFLKQKDDYEQDAREDIADEITELLSAVRATTDAHKPK